MRRWNGWGDDSIESHLRPDMLQFLRATIGPGHRRSDVALSDAAAAVARSRAPDHPLLNTDPQTRLLLARGQSFPDWVEWRWGMQGPAPDAVARPKTEAEVAAIVELAQTKGLHLIPYGGGTSVVGHLAPQAGDAAVVTVDMRGLGNLQKLDADDRLATFGAGVVGPAIEAQLRPHGLMLGHFPQSYEYSTLGGWVVTRSSGQQSLRYGRIEQMFAGGRVVTPRGTLVVPPIPASGAGTDLRELILGSEGRIGLLTEVAVRVRSVPEREVFDAGFLPTWQHGLDCVRELAQAGVPLSMMRLSNAIETRTNLLMAGRPRAIGALERYLSLRGTGDERCMLVMGYTGSRRDVSRQRRAARSAVRGHGGVLVGRPIGDAWARNRFRGPYLRNALWEHGYGVDTVETAVRWSRVTEMVEGFESAVKTSLAADGEKPHVFTHLSHMYPQGSSVYCTYVFRLAATPRQTLDRWRQLKAAVSTAIVRCGGTISHQHGVGLDHLPYLSKEKGEEGIAAISSVLRHFDPQGIMNPGKLIA